MGIAGIPRHIGNAVQWSGGFLADEKEFVFECGYRFGAHFFQVVMERVHTGNGGLVRHPCMEEPGRQLCLDRCAFCNEDIPVTVSGVAEIRSLENIRQYLEERFLIHLEIDPVGIELGGVVIQPVPGLFFQEHKDGVHRGMLNIQRHQTLVVLLCHTPGRRQPTDEVQKDSIPDSRGAYWGEELSYQAETFISVFSLSLRTDRPLLRMNFLTSLLLSFSAWRDLVLLTG